MSKLTTNGVAYDDRKPLATLGHQVRPGFELRHPRGAEPRCRPAPPRMWATRRLGSDDAGNQKAVTALINRNSVLTIHAECNATALGHNGLRWTNKRIVRR